MLCHCTLIVWSVSLTRSVSSEPTSSNVNKTDELLPLAYSNGTNISASQLSESRSLRSSHSRRLVMLLKSMSIFPIYFLSLTPPVGILREVLQANPPKKDAIEYFWQRFDTFLNNINENNP
uniref:Uncharacterized protein n=2 Tax=Tetranychus urticae TaxID=32264 RepID=T1KH22_TETUR